MASWQNRTKKKYCNSTCIKKWQNFCTLRQINHIQPSLVPVLDFLTALHQQGLTYNAIDTARNALSSSVTLEDGTCVGKHPLVSRLRKGIFRKNLQDQSTQKFGRHLHLYISTVSIPCGYLVIEGTDSKTCCVHFVSFWPKRLDCTFVEYRLHGFFLNSCNTFQLVEHLSEAKQTTHIGQ